MLEVRSAILNFLLLVLEISLNPAPDGIHERPGVPETLSEECLELNPRQGSHCLASKLVLVPTKADSITKEQSCKRGTVKASGTGGSKMVFTLLTEVVAFYVRLSIIEIGEPSLQLALSVSGGFGTTSLGLKERVHAKLRYPLKVFLGILGGSRDRDWNIQRSCITWRGDSLRRVSELVWVTVSGGAWRVSAMARCHRCGVWNRSNWASPNGLADPLGLEKLEL